ncbi:hypothetical protein OIO90_002178 [Microbotryomycetes sp. JL221]|nr:hypothetical protein OIO90_002178 [Microbotryomycetes sp. JL221]
MRLKGVLLALGAVTCAAHGPHHDGSHEQANLWIEKYGNLPDLSFSGINTFARLPHQKCLEDATVNFDIAVIGAPFDTSVSYRPGARFGPHGIRSGSRRHAPSRGYSIPWSFNPFKEGAKLLDCGDIPISPYDNTLAFEQMETAYTTLLSRPVATEYAQQLGGMKALALDGKEHPRLITLGGDHSVVLPILRALNNIYGPISVIHFDAHIDTWNHNTYVGSLTEASKITHGSFFSKASEEGLISKTSSIHAGIRTRLSEYDDLVYDEQVGFKLLTTDDLDDMGVNGIVKAIKDRVGSTPTYLSFDIDTIDPSMAPATGTPEPGGWTTREVKKILRGLNGLNFVGFDVVEVSPPYDTNAELTSMVAADLVQEFLSLLVKKGERRPAVSGMKLNGDMSTPFQSTAAHDEL